MFVHLNLFYAIHTIKGMDHIPPQKNNYSVLKNISYVNEHQVMFNVLEMIINFGNCSELLLLLF